MRYKFFVFFSFKCDQQNVHAVGMGRAEEDAPFTRKIIEFFHLVPIA